MEEQPRIHTTVDNDIANVNIFGEAKQDPLEIEEKIVKEKDGVGKG